jgi:hypothetical protein
MMYIFDVHPKPPMPLSSHLAQVENLPQHKGHKGHVANLLAVQGSKRLPGVEGLS